jgi:hypothetical protein
MLCCHAARCPSRPEGVQLSSASGTHEVGPQLAASGLAIQGDQLQLAASDGEHVARAVGVVRAEGRSA